MNLLLSIIHLYTGFFTRHSWIGVGFASVLGLLLGSFLNVVALRVPKKESFVFPPSHCVHCKHRLASKDLIPVVSYLFLRGSCRYCKAPISTIYPLGELAACLWFAIMAASLGPSADLLVGLFLTIILIAVTLTDLRYMLIPDRIVFFAITVGVLIRIAYHPMSLWQYAAGFFTGGAVLYGIAWASERFLRKEGMGGGDIKLFAFIGLMLGPGQVLLVLFTASLLGALTGSALIGAGVLSRERPMPFAPFIAMSTLMVYIWGEAWVQAYLKLITP